MQTVLSAFRSSVLSLLVAFFGCFPSTETSMEPEATGLRVFPRLQTRLLDVSCDPNPCEVPVPYGDVEIESSVSGRSLSLLLLSADLTGGGASFTTVGRIDSAFEFTLAIRSQVEHFEILFFSAVPGPESEANVLGYYWPAMAGVEQELDFPRRISGKASIDTYFDKLGQVIFQLEIVGRSHDIQKIQFRVEPHIMPKRKANLALLTPFCKTFWEMKKEQRLPLNSFPVDQQIELYLCGCLHFGKRHDDPSVVVGDQADLLIPEMIERLRTAEDDLVRWALFDLALAIHASGYPLREDPEIVETLRTALDHIAEDHRWERVECEGMFQQIMEEDSGKK